MSRLNGKSLKKLDWEAVINEVIWLDLVHASSLFISKYNTAQTRSNVEKKAVRLSYAKRRRPPD